MPESIEERHPRVFTERMVTETKRLGFKHQVYNNGLKLVIPLEGNARNREILARFAQCREEAGESHQLLVNHLLRSAKLEGHFAEKPQADIGAISKGMLSGQYSFARSEKTGEIKGIVIHFIRESNITGSNRNPLGPKR